MSAADSLPLERPASLFEVAARQRALAAWLAIDWNSWNRRAGDRRIVRSGAVLPRYLAVYLFCLNAGLGCMVVLMVYHLTGGGWGFLIRRILEAGVKTLPLSAIGFLPVALGHPLSLSVCPTERRRH